MASQQKLGLWPERRTWIDRGNPAHPAVDERLLIADAGDVEDKTKSGAGNLNLGGYFSCSIEKGLMMKALFGAILLLVICIICLGFYQGWFHITTHGTDQKSSATITVDKDKIRADESKAKEKMEEFGQKAKDKTGERTGMVTEGEHRP